MSGWYMMVKWYTANQSGRYADEMFWKTPGWLGKKKMRCEHDLQWPG
jgi:hypothetical protein